MPSLEPSVRKRIEKKDIPKVHVLRHQLGYGDPKPRGLRHFILTKSTRHWRETYVSEDGTLGTDMRDWTLDAENLKVMAHSFLAFSYGEKHWPSKRSGLLHYPADTKR